MIKGVINGYYRTGTTLVWWIVYQSLLDRDNCLILYEPHSPGVFNELKEGIKYGEKHPLHKYPVYNDYYILQKDYPFTFSEYKEKAKPKSLYLKEDLIDAVETVKPFHDLNLHIYLQTNQLHLILEDFCNYFNCNYVHIVRDVAEVLYSHASSPSKIRSIIQQLLVTLLPSYAIKQWSKIKPSGKFEIKGCLELTKDLFKLYKYKSLLERFVVMYIEINYYVLKNKTNRGLILKFEDLALEPKKYFKKLGNHLNINIKDHTFLWIDEKRVYKCPKILKDKVHNVIKRLGLSNKYAELGYQV